MSWVPGYRREGVPASQRPKLLSPQIMIDNWVADVHFICVPANAWRRVYGNCDTVQTRSAGAFAIRQ